MPEPTVSSCADWLRAFLGEGHVCEVSQVYQFARRANYSRRLVRAAKNHLKLVVTSNLDNGCRKFYWRLP